MKYSIRTIVILAAAVPALASCTKEPAAEPSSVHQSRSLDAWIKLHKPELAENRQPEGYYVEILDEGEALDDNVKPLGEAESSWVSFDMTVRTLSGRVCITRDPVLAKQEATFTKYTHYVPMFRYCGETNYTMLEGTYYALRNELATGDKTYRARIGSKLRLYLPASIAYKSTGASDSGGYGGQYSLDGGKPAMVDILVCDTVANPLQREGVDVDYFAEHNGALRPLPEVDDEPADTKADGDEEEEEEDDSMYAWRNAVDTIPQLYINRRYVPTPDRPSFDYRTESIAPYSGYAPYDNLTELDKKINAALVERFGDPAEMTPEEEKIGTDNTVRVWYIGRFLDGFVFDTNIDEVKQLVYGEVTSTGSSLSYTAKDDKSKYITAWYYSIPQLRKGQWAVILTTSTNAYGATGQSGGSTSSSSSSSSYYDYLNYFNYMNYYNNYYGGYYGGYYNNYYGGYYGGYYNNYLYDTSESTTTTTTTYSTEILPYTPLLFQIFVEK